MFTRRVAPAILRVYKLLIFILGKTMSDNQVLGKENGITASIEEFKTLLFWSINIV